MGFCALLVVEQAKALEEELETGIVNPLLGEPPEGDPNAPGSPTSSQSTEAEWRRPGDMIPDDSDDEKTGRNCCAGCCCCFCGKKPMTALELREENDRRRALGMPLISEEEGLTRKEARKRRKEVRTMYFLAGNSETRKSRILERKVWRGYVVISSRNII